MPARECYWLALRVRQRLGIGYRVPDWVCSNEWKQDEDQLDAPTGPYLLSSVSSCCDVPKVLQCPGPLQATCVEYCVEGQPQMSKTSRSLSCYCQCRLDMREMVANDDLHWAVMRTMAGETISAAKISIEGVRMARARCVAAE